MTRRVLDSLVTRTSALTTTGIIPGPGGDLTMRTTIGTIAAREYRTITAIDGYVHKFRLESCEESVSPVVTERVEPSTSLRWLLGKLALSVLALGSLAIAGWRTFM